MRSLTMIGLTLALALAMPQEGEAAPGNKADKRAEKRAEKRQDARQKRRQQREEKRRSAEEPSEEPELVFEPEPDPEPEASVSPEPAHLLEMPQSAVKPATRARHASVLDARNQGTRLYARAGVLHMVPNVSSDNVRLSNLSEFAELAISPGPIPNSGAGVASVTVPIVTVGYVLPWLDGQLSVETLLGLPIELELQATGAMATESLAPFALGNVPTGVPAIGTQLGSAKALPPIVTAVYRFLPKSMAHPYVGAGLSYMHIYDAKVTNPILIEVAQPTLDVNDAFGVVAQAGVEIKIYGRYYAMLDLKTIIGLRMSATVKDIYIRTPDIPVFEMAKAGDASVDISMLPLIGTAALGADF